MFVWKKWLLSPHICREMKTVEKGHFKLLAAGKGRAPSKEKQAVSVLHHGVAISWGWGVAGEGHALEFVCDKGKAVHVACEREKVGAPKEIEVSCFAVDHGLAKARGGLIIGIVFSDSPHKCAQVAQVHAVPIGLPKGNASPAKDIERVAHNHCRLRAGRIRCRASSGYESPSAAGDVESVKLLEADFVLALVIFPKATIHPHAASIFADGRGMSRAWGRGAGKLSGKPLIHSHSQSAGVQIVSVVKRRESCAACRHVLSHCCLFAPLESGQRGVGVQNSRLFFEADKTNTGPPTTKSIQKMR
eukprot:m.16364 g.16364  ORF g.16364 m.16364 type:complete len:303 (-) comp6879_c0_seq1:1400-2308(-)